MKKSLFAALLALLLISAWLFGGLCSASARYNPVSIRKDQEQAQKLVKKLHITEVLGPLAPVALSPFFGLACLSGTSILCNRGVLPENDFLIANEALNNGYIFLIFLALAVVTSAPKLITASKIFAEITDRLETYAGIISYAVILLLAGSGQSSQQEQIVYSAGIFILTRQGLLAIAAAINIFVISTVKYFFELLALISPIPTLDAIFEFTNKVVAGLLMVVYAFNPWVAFVLNAILFLICLSIFNWANRRIRYLKAMLLDPVILSIRKKLSAGAEYDPDAKAKEKLARHVADLELLMKVFPTRRRGRIKKKDLCYLIFAGQNLLLTKPLFFRAPVIQRLEKDMVAGEIEEGLASYSIEISGGGAHKSCELVFSRVYKRNLEPIGSRLRQFKQ